MQLDYEKGRRTEMDTFIGYPVRAGRALGLPMPIYEELYTALKGKAS
jgi:ketopantoate reductase